MQNLNSFRYGVDNKPLDTYT